MLLWSCLGVLGAYFLIRWLLQVWEMRDGMPSMFPWPITGCNMYRLMDIERAHVRVMEDAVAHGTLFRSWLMYTPIISIHDPDALRELLQRQWEPFDRSTMEQEAFNELLGDGMILIPNGERWKYMRNLFVGNAFGRKHMDTFVRLTMMRTDEMLHRLRHSTGEVDIQDELQQLAFDVITLIAIGRGWEDGKNVDVCHAWNTVLAGYAFRWVFPIPYWKFLNTAWVRDWNAKMTLLDSTVYEHIELQAQEARGERAPDAYTTTETMMKENGTLLKVLCDQLREGNQWIPDERTVRNEVLTFLFAGHDTTANLMSWALYYLWKYPQHLQRVRDEIDDTGIFADAHVTPSMRDLEQLPFLKAVLKETLRLAPSAPMRGRVLTEDVVVGQYQLKKGQFVMWSAYVTGRWKDVWGPDANDFDPDRFFDKERAAAIPRYAWVPFGAGPRRCLGESTAMLEATIALSRLVMEFDFDMALGHDSPELCFNLTFHVKDGLHMIFTPR